MHEPLLRDMMPPGHDGFACLVDPRRRDYFRPACKQPRARMRLCGPSGPGKPAVKASGARTCTSSEGVAASQARAWGPGAGQNQPVARIADPGLSKLPTTSPMFLRVFSYLVTSADAGRESPRVTTSHHHGSRLRSRAKRLQRRQV